MKAKVINKKSTHYNNIYPVLVQENEGYFCIQLDCGDRGKLWFGKNELELIND